MSAGLYGFADGVNRQIKKLYAPVDGVNREIKELWAVKDGVNRKISNADVIAKYSSGFNAQYIERSDGSTSYKSDGTYYNNTTTDGINITSTLSAQSSSSRWESLTYIAFVINDPNSYSGQPVLRINGPLVLSSSSSYKPYILNGTCEVQAVDGTNNVRPFVEFPISSALGTINLDQTIVMPTFSTTPNAYSLAFMVRYRVGAGSSTSLTAQIPWSAFTWLPAGRSLVYQP